MKSFKDKLVLITGGSSGIGLALAQQLTKEGARVWVLARDKKKLNLALEKLSQNKINPEQEIGTIRGDITDKKQINSILETWIKTHGAPDLLINSAGVAHPGYFNELDTEIFEWTMQVNFYGTVFVTKTIVPYMISRGSGHIINISSEAGFIGVFGYTAYGASKYAVRGFSDALRSELKPLGISMSIVFPPDTDTPQLIYENQYKPFETKAIAGTKKPMSADKVAAIILNHVRKNNYMIIPSFEGRIFYRLSSLLKRGTYVIIDFMVKNAQKKRYKQISKQLD